MQIHKLNETHWVIKFEGSEKYDILHIAKIKRIKPTAFMRWLIENAVKIAKETLL